MTHTMCKGGQNPPNISLARPAPPQGSLGKCIMNDDEQVIDGSNREELIAYLESHQPKLACPDCGGSGKITITATVCHRCGGTGQDQSHTVNCEECR